MSEYQLSKKAVEDLSKIWTYTFEKWSEDQADAYYSMLVNQIKRLSDNPQLGRNYEIVSENLLGFMAGHHIIFYRISEDDSILVVRILHERMDLRLRINE